jgi:hypothetical protein
MVLTRSCEIDKNPEFVLLAPVWPLDESGLSDRQRDDMVRTDCIHRVMYLPENAGKPERAALLHRAGLVRLDTLGRCEREAQLTREANEWLARKLVIFYAGVHPQTPIPLPDDDF